MSLGQNIKRLRKEHKMTLKELSSLIGISPQYLSLLERDIRDNPSQDLIRKIADILNTEVSTLMNENYDHEYNEWQQVITYARTNN